MKGKGNQIRFPFPSIFSANEIRPVVQKRQRRNDVHLLRSEPAESPEHCNRPSHSQRRAFVFHYPVSQQERSSQRRAQQQMSCSAVGSGVSGQDVWARKAALCPHVLGCRRRNIRNTALQWQCGVLPTGKGARKLSWTAILDYAPRDILSCSSIASVF